MAKPRFDLKFQIDGVADLTKAMEGQFDIARQRRVLAVTMQNATMPAVAAAKSNLMANGSVRTGALLKSIASIVRTYKNGVFVAVVGARKGMFGATKKKGGGWKLRKTRGVTRSGEERIAPEKYIHLVELGHQSIQGGGALSQNREGPIPKGFWNSANKDKTIRKGTATVTSFVPPKPFLRPAFESTKEQIKAAINFSFTRALKMETDRTIKRLSKKIVRNRKAA